MFHHNPFAILSTNTQTQQFTSAHFSKNANFIFSQRNFLHHNRFGAGWSCLRDAHHIFDIENNDLGFVSHHLSVRWVNSFEIMANNDANCFWLNFIFVLIIVNCIRLKCEVSALVRRVISEVLDWLWYHSSITWYANDLIESFDLKTFEKSKRFFH